MPVSAHVKSSAKPRICATIRAEGLEIAVANRACPWHGCGALPLQRESARKPCRSINLRDARQFGGMASAEGDDRCAERRQRKEWGRTKTTRRERCEEPEPKKDPSERREKKESGEGISTKQTDAAHPATGFEARYGHQRAAMAAAIREGCPTRPMSTASSRSGGLYAPPRRLERTRRHTRRRRTRRSP